MTVENVTSRPNVTDHRAAPADPSILLTPERGSGASDGSSCLGEIKTIVNDESAIKHVHLRPGWKRCEFTDEGHDYQGRQLIGVIDRQMWEVAEESPGTHPELESGTADQRGAEMGHQAQFE